MSAAFESPTDLMHRLFSSRATAMHGGGGQMGDEEKGETKLVKDAEPTGAGDLAQQLQVESAPTGTGSSEPNRQGTSIHMQGKIAAKVDSVATAMKSVAMSSMPAALTSKGGISGCPFMTSVFGFPTQDPTHTLKIAGHPLISDVVSLEKQQTFNRAKTVERAVHACGSGALGYFITTKDCSKWSKAAFLKGNGTRTPLAARFSTTTFGREFPDEARNPRGLAFKFYTTEGNYDVLSINFPSFFVRDGALGPDAIRSQQRNPANFQVSFDSVFDFMALVPESMLANLWFWSNHGTPQGWMHMDGYPIHAFKWVNDAGEVTFVKYKFVSAQGIKNLSQAEAQRVSGVDPDFSKREMWQHIQNGGTAEWILNIQMIPQAEIGKCTFDPFDCSKPWPESMFPWTEIGRVVLDKNPENYHRDVEQIAFSPGRLVPGIEPTPDPLLQWRTWLYLDAQLHRLGVNYHQIPVNTPFMTNQYHPITRDGVMRTDANGGHEPHYYPNSACSVPGLTATTASIKAPGAYAPIPDVTSNWTKETYNNAVTASRGLNATTEGDPVADYLVARDFYLNGLTDTDRTALHTNIGYSLRTVSRKEIVVRWLIACHRTHPSFALGVYESLVAECGRANAKPQVTLEEIMQCVKAVEGKPLVDVHKAYQPVALPIKM